MGHKKAAEKYQQVYLRITSTSPVWRSALHARICSQLERGEVDSESSVLFLLLNTPFNFSFFQ